MRTLLSKLILLSVLILLSGCAAYYKPINPPGLEYTTHDIQDGVSLSYKYDVLRETGNRKYANKEQMSDVKVIAVRLTNNSDTVLNVGKDLFFYAKGNQLYLMEPYEIKTYLKQHAAGYIAYITIPIANLALTDGYTKGAFPITALFGSVLAIANTALAGSSNKEFMNELSKYSMLNRCILPGETVYGLIGVYDSFYIPISVKRIRNSAVIQ